MHIPLAALPAGIYPPLCCFLAVMPHRRERAGLRCDAQDPFALLTLPGRDLSASSLLGGVRGHPNPAARSQVPSARGQLRGWPIPARLHPARQRRFRERGRYRAERSGDEAAAAGVCAGTDRQRHHGGADPVSAHRDAPCWGCAVRGGCAVLCWGCAVLGMCCAVPGMCWALCAGLARPGPARHALWGCAGGGGRAGDTAGPPRAAAGGAPGALRWRSVTSSGCSTATGQLQDATGRV